MGRSEVRQRRRKPDCGRIVSWSFGQLVSERRPEAKRSLAAIQTQVSWLHQRAEHSSSSSDDRERRNGDYLQTARSIQAVLQSIRGTGGCAEQTDERTE